MKLLLDENLPKRLKLDFSEDEIYTVRDKEWNGVKNGELLQLMITEHFDALLTFDKNLQFQQNFEKYLIPVLVLNATDNTYLTLKKLVPKIKEILKTPLNAGPIEIKENLSEL
jgi:predicted nuclease of predicted toxin-antitoxin system